MTKDLEDTIAELGSGYREVAIRVMDAYRVPMVAEKARSRGVKPLASKSGMVFGWTPWYLVAASLLVFLGLGVAFRECSVAGRQDGYAIYTVAYERDPAALSRIVSTQRPDGSWGNDFLTRQNAAALRDSSYGENCVAYKKAMRYLRSKGLKPLTQFELKLREEERAHFALKS